MKVAVLDIKGKETGRKVELSDDVFAIEPNEHAIYLDVKQYLAHQRQGTHKAKERAEIAGSTRKIKKQKVRVPQGPVVSNHRFLEVVVEFLVPDLRIIPKS